MFLRMNVPMDIKKTMKKDLPFDIKVQHRILSVRQYGIGTRITNRSVKTVQTSERNPRLYMNLYITKRHFSS